jgi:undecaprenyl-diphosphatase
MGTAMDMDDYSDLDLTAPSTAKGAGRSAVRRDEAGVPRRIRAVPSLVVIATLLTLFTAVGWSATQGWTQAFDEGFMRWLDLRATDDLTRWILALTDLGDWQVTVAIGMAASGVLWVHGQRMAALFIWVALSGTLLLDNFTKELFGRDRPSVFEWRTDYASGGSFPSGHTMNATVAFTLIAHMIARFAESRVLRLFAALMAATIIVGVALSRVYIGVHYPTDVVGGALIGGAWALTCILVLQAIE